MGKHDAFIAKWEASGAAERANKDAFLLDLCDVLGVPRPTPTTGDTEKDLYVFERDAKLSHAGGAVTIGKIDLYKSGAFILEAKQGSEAGAKKIGTAKRGTPAWNIAMNDAYGQALGYARSFDTPVPFLVACDIGHCFDLYAAFDGSWDYRPFPNAQAQRIYLRDLTNEKHAETLRKVFTDPHALDPSKHAAKITREVAGYLGNLAKKLEEDGHPQELVATFLMRCLFTMFAEDVGLLPEHAFTNALEKFWIPSPASFPGGIESLWRTMNDGGHVFGVVGKILRFNGGLFKAPTPLPLDDHALRLLLLAAKCDWSDVEPAIFGTLLERALDPKERHRLGAHYTPRAYVERLVRPTIEEPLRADWDIVQAHVRQLVIEAEDKDKPEKKKKLIEEAVAEVRAFHEKLCKTRVLDPACGSGNFLYVTLDIFKRLEGEVLALLDSLGVTQQTLVHMEGLRVTPAQFHGIEIKRWAKEIAELVLWIGYLQWHFKLYGEKVPVPEPVLQDFKNIECRDAVLAYDAEELVRGENGKPITRWDGETTKKSPVTGEDVPDERSQVPIYRYVHPRQAEWPEADFIVGNPPYIGTRRMRSTLGDEYVSALRGAYPSVPETADLVMYWWYHAAMRITSLQTRRFGLITTNSITQQYSSPVVQAAMDQGLRLTFAVADHPWVDEKDGAKVRVAMTVGENVSVGTAPHLGVVTSETEEEVSVVVVDGPLLNAKLSFGVDAARAAMLAANQGMCFQGVVPAGDGFKLEADEAAALLGGGRHPSVVRPYIIGRDIVQRAEPRFIIDFFGYTEEDAMKDYPALYQHLLERVLPERRHNKRKAYRDRWWVFAEPRPAMRRALEKLPRFIVTPYTAKFRPFMFVGRGTLPDAMAYSIASDDPFVLGVLSSRVHAQWCLVSGGTLEDRPRYNSKLTFYPFPFPPSGEVRAGLVARFAEDLDAHRKARQAVHSDLTITGMYNVLEKLRSGEALTAKDRIIHEHGLVSVLKKIHDDLDSAVFDAYGWPHDLTDEQILEKLVALNKERSDEEKRGTIRWLRPDFQNPTGNGSVAMTQVALTEVADGDETPTVAAAAAVPWPKKMAAQIQVVRDLVTRSSDEIAATDVARAFKGAKRKDVEDVLESLTALGLLVSYELVEGKRWRAARFTKSASVPPQPMTT